MDEDDGNWWFGGFGAGFRGRGGGCVVELAVVQSQEGHAGADVASRMDERQQGRLCYCMILLSSSR